MRDGERDPVRYSTAMERGDWMLALETSGPEGSVALGRGGDVVADRTLGVPRQHAAGLLTAVQGLLEAEGISVRDIGGIVVGAGPGSFTGVRVAAASTKGLWHGLGVPVWPVSSLRAAVCDPRAPWSTPVRAAFFDARGSRVYAAAYRVESGAIAEIVAPFAVDLDEAVSRVVSASGTVPPTFCGSGAWRHLERLVDAGFQVEKPPLGRPSAGGLLSALRLDPATKAHENPAQWEPEYLRASSAERSRREAGMFDSGP